MVGAISPGGVSRVRTHNLVSEHPPLIPLTQPAVPVQGEGGTRCFGCFPQVPNPTPRVHRYVEALPGKQIGFHGHHNQQLGMANSIDAITEGANMVDGSILGLGRGAGNTPTENVLCFLRNPKYNVRPIFEVIEKQFYELKKTVLRQPPPPASTLFSPLQPSAAWYESPPPRPCVTFTTSFVVVNNLLTSLYWEMT